MKRVLPYLALVAVLLAAGSVARPAMREEPPDTGRGERLRSMIFDALDTMEERGPTWHERSR